MRVPVTPLFVGPLAMAIGGVFVLFAEGTALSPPEPIPGVVRVICGVVGLLLVWAGVYQLRLYGRMRWVVKDAAPVPAALRLVVTDWDDRETYSVFARVHGSVFEAAVRGGAALKGARDGDETEGLAWIEPRTGLPLALAVIRDGDRVPLDLYGVTYVPTDA